MYLLKVWCKNIKHAIFIVLQETCNHYRSEAKLILARHGTQSFMLMMGVYSVLIATCTGLELQILWGTQFQGHSRRAPKATVPKNTIEV